MNIIIVGASPKKDRYSNKAIRAYLKKGYDVYPVNPKYKEIEGLKAYSSVRDVPLKEPDIVSIYVNPKTVKTIIDDIIQIKPKKIIFNPGSESEEEVRKLRNLGFDVVLACTILSLGEDPNNY